MDKVKNVPEVRFKDCGNAWFKDKLSELCDVRDGTHDSPTYLDSGYFFITSKNVKRGYINFEEIKFISKEDYDNINKRSKVDVGDILFGMIGTIGNIAIVRKEPYYAIKNVALIKDIRKLYNYFNYYYLQSPNIEKQLDNVLDGGTQKFISLKSIRRLDIIFPGCEEQTQIGNLFKNIDEKLELEKEKHEKLINFRKAMLEDMFPKEGKKVPKVRFDGFDDEWRYTALKNILSSEKKGKAQLSLLKSGKNLYLDADALNGNREFFCDVVPDVTKMDVLILWDGSKAGTVYSNIEGVLGSTLKSLTFNDSINSYYVYSFLDSKKDTIFNYYRTPNIPHVVRNFTSSFEIPVPSPEEQALIGNFFKNLDEKIELSEQKIAKIENFKKAMLDKMFV